jgi:hypothetical protein
MPDMTSPNPFIMTHFEQIATVSALFALCLRIVIDVWRSRRRSVSQSTG